MVVRRPSGCAQARRVSHTRTHHDVLKKIPLVEPSPPHWADNSATCIPTSLTRRRCAFPSTLTRLLLPPSPTRSSLTLCPPPVLCFFAALLSHVIKIFSPAVSYPVVCAVTHFGFCCRFSCKEPLSFQNLIVTCYRPEDIFLPACMRVDLADCSPISHCPCAAHPS